MATAEPTTRIEEAEQRKQRALEALNRAHAELCDAQNRIAFVEGEGSADLYEQIGDSKATVSGLQGKLLAMKPTGLFET